MNAPEHLPPEILILTTGNFPKAPFAAELSWITWNFYSQAFTIQTESITRKVNRFWVFNDFNANVLDWRLSFH